MRKKLQADLTLLKKQIFWLQHSYDECRSIGVKKEYSIDEFGHFETLCSRYARSIDFLIRKFFRTLDAYEFENQGTLIDVVNHAHKRGLFDDIEELRVMKDLRNTVVHEYVEEDLIEIFDEVLHHAKKLLEIMNRSITYTEKTLNE